MKHSCTTKLWRTAAAGAVLCVNLSAAVAVDAAVTPWVGTADYTQAPGGTAANTDVVGPFSSYDFSSNGVILLQSPGGQGFGGLSVGDVIHGDYESYVEAHTYGTNTVPSPKLNTDVNVSGGYELTIAATFDDTVTSIDPVSGAAVFSVTGGTANLYFGVPPNRSFSSDSGFDDGAAILGGTVSGGTGSFLPSQGIGFSSFSLSIGNLNYDHAVYTPNTIGGGNGIFSLEINPTGVTQQVSAVLGHGVQSNDALLQADGSLNLVSAPLPPAVLCLGSALLGLMAWGPRRRSKRLL